MLTHLYSASISGLDCKLIDVEVDFRRGNYAFHIVGLGDKSVQESKERVSSAIKNSGFQFTPMVIIANLAPAELPKSGSSFDLPIAIGYLASSNQIIADFQDKLMIGELGLDGSLKSIKGVLSIVDFAKKSGFSEIFIPNDNFNEASFISGIKILPVKSLKEVVEHLNKIKEIVIPTARDRSFSKNPPNYDLADVKGQRFPKKALEICAAGGHNLLMQGPPGSGKTMLSKALPGILPDLSSEEALEVTKIYSISGFTNESNAIVNSRPFRSPHHTASYSALIGGGILPRPGEISLAHRGVLFLDEFPEFPSKSIEALRQPLEDKIVTISRVNSTLTFPSNFILVGAMNPCRCGFYRDKYNTCKCTQNEIKSYRRKLSGPILDRIDLLVNVTKVENEALFSEDIVETSSQVKLRVQKAKFIQEDRYKNLNIFSNSELKQSDFKKYLNMTPKALAFIKYAADKLNLSARVIYKLMRTSRTIADLEFLEKVEERHLKDAINYRVKI